MKAYWFSKGGRSHGNTYTVRPEPFVEDEPVVPCIHGLHAGEDPFQALLFANNGNMVDIVELDGQIKEHGIGLNHKYVASHRTHIKRIDALPIIREFTRWCALRVIHLWECPEVVKQYLETGDPTLQKKAYKAVYDANRVLMVKGDRTVVHRANRAACMACHPNVVAGDAEEAAYAVVDATTSHTIADEIAIIPLRVKFNEMIDAAFAKETP